MTTPVRRPFSTFLRAYRWQILFVLLLASAVRFAFLIEAPPVQADALYRYSATANNVLAGHGFSVDTTAPYRPSQATVPLYPLFVAAIYTVFGHQESIVRLVQVFLDLGTCLLTAFVAFNLAPNRLKEMAAISSLAIYAVFKYAAMWTAFLLTETLAIFLTMAAIALCVMAIKRERKEVMFWFAAGAACGLALLTRPDSLLLMGAILLFLIARVVLERSRQLALGIASFCFAIILILLPWAARNYISMGTFQPLASEYGFAQGGYMPTGYLLWIRTWMTKEDEMPAFHPAFFPDKAIFFDAGVLPEAAFDSATERQQVMELIARYNQARLFTPDIDTEFRALALERIKRAPVRFLIVIPVRRSAYLWLQGPYTGQPLRLTLRLMVLLPIIVGGILGFALWCRRQPLAALLLIIITTRSVFMAYHYATETRYILEVYPPLIAACGVTIAALLLRARNLRSATTDARSSLALS
jgi:4-amino-4-deoxy-L-arabinose transferase-like glycosyltransferase